MVTISKEMERSLINALHSFGVHCKRRSGLECTIKAMKLVWEDQNRMRNLSQNVYLVVTVQDSDLDASGVSSAIQRVAEKAWRNNRKLLLAYDHSLMRIPTNYEFLEILLHYLEDPDRERYL